MKKTTAKRLSLHSETLRALSSLTDLRQAAAGVPTQKPLTLCGLSGCPNTCLC